jgi:hypothetical protein
MDFSGGDEPCGRGLGDAEVSRREGVASGVVQEV